ncbi:MAG: hypothetical protein ACYDCC_16350 [Actinomycetota bacterium]
MRRALCLCFVFVCACTSQSLSALRSPAPVDPSSIARTPAPSESSGACRSGNPLAHVYAPRRLQVHNPCVTVRGTVMKVKRELDFDIHIDIELDPEFSDMINDQNRAQQHGYLVLEIVPADQSICIFNKGHSTTWSLCTGADLPTPKLGEHISATGPYVTDLVHGWNEIHPVWDWSVT